MIKLKDIRRLNCLICLLTTNTYNTTNSNEQKETELLIHYILDKKFKYKFSDITEMMMKILVNLLHAGKFALLDTREITMEDYKELLSTSNFVFYKAKSKTFWQHFAQQLGNYEAFVVALLNYAALIKSVVSSNDKNHLYKTGTEICNNMPFIELDLNFQSPILNDFSGMLDVLSIGLTQGIIEYKDDGKMMQHYTMQCQLGLVYVIAYIYLVYGDVGMQYNGSVVADLFSDKFKKFYRYKNVYYKDDDDNPVMCDFIAKWKDVLPLALTMHNKTQIGDFIKDIEKL